MNQNNQPTTAARRYWLAPAIALVLALVFLLVLLIPGVLRFRDTPDMATVAALQDANATLEAEINRLAQADSAGVCMYDGALFPRSVEGSAAPPDPSQRLDLLPPHPGNMPAGADAVADPASFDGSIDELLRRSTVLVLAREGDGFINGSGFFIDAQHLVTNAHVVGSAQEVLITNDLIREPLPARVVAHSHLDPAGPLPQPDFALLRLEAGLPDTLPLTLAPPQRTQVVYASGYPGFFLETQIREYFASVLQGQSAVPPEAVVTDGMITTIQNAQRADGALGYIPHTAKILPGNSGGPLVDSCGRVVGINTFISHRADENLIQQGDYALSAQNLADFLRQNGVTPHQTDSACSPAHLARVDDMAEPAQ